MLKTLPGKKIAFSRTIIFLLLFFIIEMNSGFGQVSSYIWSQTSGTYNVGYNTLAGIQPIDKDGSNSNRPARWFEVSWDDDTAVYVIPFAFQYNGISYPANSAIGVDSDGWICFGNHPLTMTGQLSTGSWVSVSDHTGIYLNGAANNNGFAAFNADLNDQSWGSFTGSFTSGSKTISGISSTAGLRVGMRVDGTAVPDGSIITSVSANSITMSANANGTGNFSFTVYSSIIVFIKGTAPNRQFVVQWTGVKRYNSPAIIGDDFNFQIALDEGGGSPGLQALHAYYGPFSAVNASNLNAQVGLRGADASDYNARTSTTNWSATTAATLNTQTVRFNNSIFPASGLQFNWSPCSAAPTGTAVLSGASPVCPSTSQTYTVSGVTGATNYAWTYTGTGAVFNATTTTPSNSFNFSAAATSGVISVTPSNACGTISTATKSVTITSVAAASITYPSGSYCKSVSGTVSPTITGVTGGSFSSAPAGLSITSGGVVTPSSSSAGNYLITYTYTNSGCTGTATAYLNILELPAVTTTATPSVLCTSGSSQLNASLSNGPGTYSVIPIPYSVLSPSGSPTNVFSTNIDDGNSSAIPMPFSFSYFGTAATQFFINSNGHIQISGTAYTGFTTQTLPNPATPNGVIALAWADLVVDPSTNPGANVRYFVNGSTPNRILVVEYTNVRFLSGGSSQNVTGQIRLYESDSHIEIAITTVNDNAASISKTLGIENSTGTIGYAPPGRNNAVWNTSNEAWSFQPVTGPFTYSWSPGTYLSSTSVYNPVANSMGSSTTYDVTVTNTATGCFSVTPLTVSVVGPMMGTYTVGSGGNYPTLTAAVNDYNTRCIGGPVIFSLISAAYSAGETFPIYIKQNAYQSPVNTLTIKPATGITATISGNVSGNALIRVKGNYIKIDGSNTVNGLTRNLTITNTNTTSPVPIAVVSGGVSPVTGVSLKNCVISSGSYSSGETGIVFSDSVTLYNTGYFLNDTVYNNKIEKVSYGIDIYAVSATGNGSGLYIANNELNSTGTSAIYYDGIYVEGVDGGTIEGNSLANFYGADASDDAGIWIAAGSKNIKVVRNLIHSLNYTGTGGYGSYGIYISAAGAINTFVSNNMISNISGDGYDYTSSLFGYDNPTGILLYATSANPQTGVRLYHNTINMYGGTLNKTNAVSFGIRLSAYVTADIRNNIINNNLGLLTSTGTGAVGIYAATASSQFSYLDYNDYYVNPSPGLKYFGGINGTFQTTLAGWKSATTKEINGLNVNPVFVSGTDLHLVPASNTALNQTCLPLPEVPLDYDSTTRNGLRPDVGADEFLLPNTGSWVGRTSIEWLEKSNWETNVIPDNTTDVTVTGGYSYLPTLITTQAVRDLNMSNSNPVITINGGTLQVFKNINLTAGYIIGSNGTLEMKGTAAQSIPASLFQNNNLLNLIIDNTESTTGVALGGPLDIYRSLSFGSSGKTLTTNDNLCFKSTATQTAWLGQLSPSNIITGKATIERNIPLHSKAWQLLSTPIHSSNTTTVKQAWQEASTMANNNPNPGFGTQLGSTRADATVHPSPGFDVKSSTPSIKVYDRNINNYRALNRTDTLIYNPKGYMVFVRGDRSVINFSGANSSPTQTVLRMKGTLNTPATPPASIVVSSAGFESAGNPYPSAINFRNLGFSGSINQNNFYLWDPKLTNSNSVYGLGAFQTFTWNGTTFDVTPGGGSFTGMNRNIESGQAFFFQTSGAGTLSFPETAKSAGSNNNNRSIIPPRMKMMRTNLMVVVNDQRELIDGTLLQFGNYNNDVDDFDAIKLNNAGENLSILNGNSLLAVEKRENIVETDTVFYRLGQLRGQEYDFQFVPMELSATGLSAWLEDNYLHTSTPVTLMDTSYVRFRVLNDPASYAADRFRLVFIQKRKPVQPHEADVVYVEEGGDGNLKNAAQEAFVTVYPNPVVNGMIHLKATNFKRENLLVQLVNSLGQVLLTQMLKTVANRQEFLIDARSFPGGTYLISVITEGGKRFSIPLNL
jgi:hypothetical protein